MTQKTELTGVEIKAAYMDGYNRGVSDGSNQAGYDTTLSETIKSEADHNRAIGYDAGYSDFFQD